jgi:predicted PurR-regulated permease PerM
MFSQTPHMTIEKWFFLLITGIVLYLFWTVIQPFAFVLLIAGVVAIILSPVDRLLCKWVKSPRLSAIMLAVGVFLLVFVPILILLLLMAHQASDLVQATIADTSWLDQLNPETSPLFAALPVVLQEQLLAIDLIGIGQSAASWAFDNVGNVFSSTTKLLLNTFMFFIALYYLLVERERMYAEALALSPLRDSIDEKILKRITNTLRQVVFGVLLLAIVQGLLAGIGMTIFGVPGSIMWGAVTIVAALVPFVGTALVLIPAVLYLFFTGSTAAAVGLFIWSVVFVGLADNFIGPYLIRGTTHMHAFLVLLSVLGGLMTFGPVGVLVGPTVLAAMLALIELYKSGILTTGKLSKE